ncbi:MAG: hypothetical protein F4Z58_09080 [Acidimicrobiaceae bacterium]|nr:hypothetical protein [Acidimicrobiaceae bacterium]MYD07890.1 hypothetical protein [Acidimicrobiaceae bacterium]MYI59385.1 hypothetical protein [Acidimicrobiaceae bacterium]
MVRHLWRWLIVGIVLVLLASALSCEDEPASTADPDGPAEPDTDGDSPSRTGVGTGSGSAGEEPNLKVRLSEGSASGTETLAVVTRVEGRELSETEISAVTDRLGAWDYSEDDDTVDFNRPPESLPRPRVGATIESPFPTESDVETPVVDSGPLEVLRVQPEGEVGIAPFVSITFNQAMVPLTTLAQLDEIDVPVTMTPSLPGRWQWIGTRTLRFEHDPAVFDRLPMATSYVVEIPAGTTSQSGGELADTVRFEFETPAPTVLSLSPQHDSLDVQPVFLATFDQRVDAAAVLETITLSADGTEHDIRLATDAEIEGDEDVQRRTGLALDGTWVAFTPVSELEPDSAITIEVGPNVPSAEGPNTSDALLVVQARTYAALRVDQVGCSAVYPCWPGSWLSVYFNNVLDPDTLDIADLDISPELPDARLRVDYNSVNIIAPTEGGTLYEVVIPATLGDEFGQALGEPVTVDFHIDEARPFIRAAGRRLVTLDPLVEQQTIPVTVRQHEQLRVRLYDVDSSDYGSFQSFLERWDRARDGELSTPPWTPVSDEVVDTGIDSDAVTEVRIDLDDALGGAHGHVVAIVEGVGRFADLTYSDDDFWSNRPVVAWVQDTDIGVDMITDHREVVVWATDLRSGDPLEGVDVNLEGRGSSLTTDSDGLARASIVGESSWIVAKLGGDQAINPANVRALSLQDQLIWYTADDRGTYRPGETLHLKGWVRNLDLSGDGSLEFLPPQQLMTYRASDSFGNELAEGSFRLDEHGGFDLTIELRDGANLGHAWIEFGGPQNRENSWHYHQFQIQEFRRPEFEVIARLESPGPFFVDEPATVAVDARYFSGGPLPNAEVSWIVTTREASYSPPNWNEFTFGVWTPWWHYGGFGGGDDWYWEEDYGYGGPFEEPVRETFSGLTDAGGSHYLQMDFDGDGDQLPTTVTAEAQVLDVNRQQWASSTDVLVHAADLYVGVRSTRTFVRAGDGFDVEAIVTDIDGNAVPDRAFEITASRLLEDFINGEWTEVAVDTETCNVTSADEPVACEFEAAVGGRYRIDAKVVDDAGRTNRSEMTRWVTGGKSGVPSRNVELEGVSLIPDAETYAAGETAEILVDSPFSSGTGLLVTARNEIIELRTFEIVDHAAVLEVPITDDHVPELTVRVEIVSTTERTADDGTVLDNVAHRPAYGTGEIRLRVPPARRALGVTVTPAASRVKPGDSTSVTVQVNDADGAPVDNADVLLVVVDEAVLALSGYQLVDPLEVFYRSLGVYLDARRARDSILLQNPQELLDSIGGDGAVTTTVAASMADEAGDDMADAEMAEESADSASSGRLSAQGLQIEVRENLDALALFDPEVATDADGVATVEFDLPDSLTRYRVMAIAVDGEERFGSAESAVTARLPLQVRPSAPRFLNFGDRFELPIVVQNQTDSPAEVDVVVQASNLILDGDLNLEGSAGRRITVPANDRVEVRFGASTSSVGTARFRVAAVSGDNADAQVVSLPVYTPATSEAFATYGVLDSGVVGYSLTEPRDVFPQFGGLELNTSSTALQTLTDAVLYISEYRYASADAHASRILAISALRDVLGAFDAEGLPTPAELDAVVRSDISELAALQHTDGGFGWWSRRGVSYPYPSIQAMHALVTARTAGFTVPNEVMENGRWYLRNIEDRIPPEYSRKSKDMLSAYALHVRALDGDRDLRAARELWNRRGADLELDALAWIWPVVGDDDIEADIERVFNNRVTETAEAATFVTDYGEDAYLILASDRRTDGIVLDALITMAPESDLIGKVVAGLLSNQVKGRWNNVQENSFILLGLDSYFDTFEAVDPDFVARVWLGDQYVAEHEFSGRTTDRGATLVPMADLIAAGDADLTVQNDGSGRLYYRLGLRYAPASLELDPLDRGFVVQRSYEAVDDPDNVWLDSDGVWHVVAGAEVRVKLTMVNDSRRTNMVLVDPLPAGFEALNPALAVTGEIEAPRTDAADYWWRWTWYEHQNLRDDRTEAFSSYLWAGTHEYSYVARATTPGTFVAPPAKAEEIYAPEVFGRSASDTVIIEDSVPPS